jgi:FkbM family methyltransferase
MTELKPRRTTLPNGLYAYSNARGAALAYQKPDSIHSRILDYFEHGIDVREGMTVLDVGANIGIFALEVLYRTGGQVKLLCFEPGKLAYQLLVRSVSEQFPESDVSMFPCGLFREKTSATLYERPEAPSLSSLDRSANLVPDLPGRIANLVHDPKLPESHRESMPWWLRFVPKFVIRSHAARAFRRAHENVLAVECELTTVSHVIGEAGLDRVDLLKVDVEGAELDVILGIDEADWPKIQTAVIEVHDVAGRVGEIEGAFRRHGFEKIVVDQDYVFRGTDIYNLYALRE